ncbi:helix-turn-helix domain-containing protein [Aridibaculum aurantiacum]|uniref:helix-turn-helix domain-containing protein n=1 Tax=Aridibaculum aurantiacum TaxID=2810307 RepID=UPI001A978DB1|nr:helix-turn-helix domain-containing protein [Aridibaculum aurantiacum]
MNLEILTREDMKNFKTELLEEIRRIIQPASDQKEWLKSSDVMKLLNCSPGTLQNLRINGTLPFTKMGGTIYYSYNDVMQVLNGNKRNAA